MEKRTSSAERGYNGRWQKARATFLRSHPLCCNCATLGITTAATVVDHITPHKGDQSLFWDVANWQPLCKPCHDRWKQRMEKSGASIGCDSSGVPVDPSHHWRRGRAGAKSGPIGP